jgi:uncharacterized protein (DUF1684 family)
MSHEHEHEHTFKYDWRTELEALRESARHFYQHQFDWRGHEPPADFTGPRYFEPDEDWRLAAHLDRTVAGTGDPVTLATSTGQLREMKIAGQLVFKTGDAERRLSAFITNDAEGYEVLFVPFRDATSGLETYGAGRYVEAPFDKESDEVELDFNFAYNPSCAYSPSYDCPYPPPGNRLDVPVRAGEMLPFEKPA